MSSQGKRANIVRAIVILGLTVVVLGGFWLYPRIPSLYSRYLAWGGKRYCVSMLAEGQTYGTSDDYTSQLKNCERNPRFCSFSDSACINE